MTWWAYKLLLLRQIIEGTDLVRVHVLARVHHEEGTSQADVRIAQTETETETDAEEINPETETNLGKVSTSHPFCSNFPANLQGEADVKRENGTPNPQSVAKTEPIDIDIKLEDGDAPPVDADFDLAATMGFAGFGTTKVCIVIFG